MRGGDLHSLTHHETRSGPTLQQAEDTNGANTIRAHSGAKDETHVYTYQ